MTRRSLVYLDLGLIAAVMIIAMVYLFTGPAARRAELSEKERELAIRKGRLSQGGKPLGEAKTALDEAVAKVDKALLSLESLVLPIGERYRPEGKENPPNYYKQLLVTLQKRVSGGQTGPTYSDESPLGFTAKMEEKESVRMLLLRVAAVERLVETLRAAGPVKVGTIEHQPIRPFAGAQEACPGAALIPIKVSFIGTERQAAAFVAALAAPATAGALETFRMESPSGSEGLKVEALVSFVATDAGDILPKAVGDASGQKPGIRRW